MILTVILLCVSVAVLVTIHVCVVGRVVGRRDGEETIPTATVCNGGLKPLTKEELKNLPRFNYKAAAAAVTEREPGSPVDCVVCLEHFNVGDSCRMLPNCDHSFHAVCIDSWVLKNPICPICRIRVYPPKVDMVLSGESVA